MTAPVGRPYRMVSRARKTAETGEGIMDAAVALFWEQPTDQMSLEAVARRAGVTVQTVIRRFGGKDGLITASVERETQRVVRSRDPAAIHNVTDAVRQLVDHYEEMGDRVIRLLAEEERLPALRRITDVGRKYHRGWCEQVFAAALAGRRGVARERRIALLVATCDVYTWKLLRRDAGPSRRQAELALIELLEPLVEGS